MFSRATALLVLCCVEILEPRGKCWLYPVWWAPITNVSKYLNLLQSFSYCHYNAEHFQHSLSSSCDTNPSPQKQHWHWDCDPWCHSHVPETLQTFTLLQFCYFHSLGTAAWLPSHTLISWLREAAVSQELLTKLIKEQQHHPRMKW